MKSTIQRAVILLSGVLALLHRTDSLAQPAALATNQVALRVLIITGGHDHEAAFYGLFDKETYKVFSSPRTSSRCS